MRHATRLGRISEKLLLEIDMPNDPGFTLHQIEIGGKLILFEDGRYDTKIVTSICQGGYEATERSIVPKLFRPGDRVLEIGTAVGLVTMVLADVVGNENVIGFEANPNLIEDARRNFAANNHVITVKNQVLQKIRRASRACLRPGPVLLRVLVPHPLPGAPCRSACRPAIRADTLRLGGDTA